MADKPMLIRKEFELAKAKVDRLASKRVRAALAEERLIALVLLHDLEAQCDAAYAAVARWRATVDRSLKHTDEVIEIAKHWKAVATGISDEDDLTPPVKH